MKRSKHSSPWSEKPVCMFILFICLLLILFLKFVLQDQRNSFDCGNLSALSFSMPKVFRMVHVSNAHRLFGKKKTMHCSGPHWKTKRLILLSRSSPAPPDIKELEAEISKMPGRISSSSFLSAIVWTLTARQNWRSWNFTSDEYKCCWFSWIEKKDDLKSELMQISSSGVRKNWGIPGNIRFRHPITPYEGQMLSGLVEQTFVRGIKVYDKSSLVSSPTRMWILKPW